MANEENGTALILDVFDSSKALALKGFVTYRKRLIHDEDVRININGGCEGEAHIHARRIGLYRLINKRTYIGKPCDLVETPFHLLTRYAEYRGVEEDIFSAGEFWIEAGTKFE